MEPISFPLPMRIYIFCQMDVLTAASQSHQARGEGVEVANVANVTIKAAWREESARTSPARPIHPRSEVDPGYRVMHP